MKLEVFFLALSGIASVLGGCGGQAYDSSSSGSEAGADGSVDGQSGAGGSVEGGQSGAGGSVDGGQGGTGGDASDGGSGGAPDAAPDDAEGDTSEGDPDAELCAFPYYLCLDSCDATTAEDVPPDYCHVGYPDGCPGTMVSTESCGYCTNWAGTDCWDSTMLGCLYVEGYWRTCCGDDPACVS